MVFLPMRRAALLGGGGLLLAMVVAAEMVTFEVRDVPVARLTANIERIIAAHPRDVQLRVNLARAHVMAYALKKSALPVATHDPDKPFDGYLKENVQPEVRKTSNAEEVRRAQEHLRQAIRVYREALAIDDKHPLANLGYAWAVKENGDTAKAVEAFRRTVEIAWPGDRARDMNMHGWRSVTEEATRRLIGHGYEALRALDNDGDGRLRGSELAGLALWRDENGDGRSHRREVRPVAAWGIVELSCAYELDPRHQDEIVTSLRGVVFRDGTVRPTFDVLLHRARH